MASIVETINSLQAYGKTPYGTNPMGEFFRVLGHIVQEDVSQAERILGPSEDKGFITSSRVYMQRMVEMAYIFTEVFLRDEYKEWQPTSDTPRVIDLGGDPGAVSVLYWKYRKPNAQVTVVEANPATVHTMLRRLERKGLKDIEVINAAIAGDKDGYAPLQLHRPGVGWHTQDYVRNEDELHSSPGYIVEVPKVTLSSLIKEGEQIDLLKVDIEGSEGDAIRELYESGKLQQVNQIIMEFHHGPDWPDNSLTEMMRMLYINGFEIDEAHITIGKGLRNKRQVSPSDFASIAQSNQKVFLTFSASRRN